ncbi:hypothetical protein LXL04_023867 [Taraxacum kok-saghyz]
MVECYECHNLGHFEYEYPNREKGANYAGFNEEEDMLLMAVVDDNQKKQGVWFLDSGCSNHMSGNKGWFVQLDESFRHSVKLRNDSRLQVMGKSNIIIEIQDQTQTINNVYFVHDLRNNLLSMGQIQYKDITILIKRRVCKLYHSRRGCIIESEMTANRMFIPHTNMLTNGAICFKVDAEETNDLWYRRFGHLSYQNMSLLYNKKMVSGMPEIKTTKKACSGCIIGKQSRSPIPKKCTYRAARRL